VLRSWQFVSTVLKIIFRHPIFGVTLIPVLPDGTIVLVHRQDDGKWGLAGGMVDWGEDIPQAVKRELKEETGLDLIKIKRLVGVYSAPDRDPRIHSISVLLEVEVQGNIKVEDTLEISEAQAFYPDDLPRGNLAHDHDRQLDDYLQGKITIA
jgi:8-oxo-dGTP diphosphatase